MHIMETFSQDKLKEWMLNLQHALTQENMQQFFNETSVWTATNWAAVVLWFEENVMPCETAGIVALVTLAVAAVGTGIGLAIYYFGIPPPPPPPPAPPVSTPVLIGCIVGLLLLLGLIVVPVLAVRASQVATPEETPTKFQHLGLTIRCVLVPCDPSPQSFNSPEHVLGCLFFRS